MSSCTVPIYRLLVGLKGALSDAWTYDINGQWGHTDSHERLSNDISNTRLALVQPRCRAIKVIGTQWSGTMVCRTPTAPTAPRSNNADESLIVASISEMIEAGRPCLEVA
jgi:hypothetical protein